MYVCVCVCVCERERERERERESLCVHIYIYIYIYMLSQRMQKGLAIVQVLYKLYWTNPGSNNSQIAIVLPLTSHLYNINQPLRSGRIWNKVNF